jgi:hypothetical protein
VLVLKVTPAEASYLTISIMLIGIFGACSAPAGAAYDEKAYASPSPAGTRA